MKKQARLTVVLILGLIFVSSLIALISKNKDYREGKEAYAEAEELVQLPDLSQLPPPVVTPEPAPVPEEPAEEAPEEPKPVYIDPYADALRAMDFAALREVNEDVLGWITIPGTPISYPLLQGEDDEYYLDHTWKKWDSVVGAIFMEARNARDLSDFNTIIYGHRMNNGTMFAALKYYKKLSYWKEHPCIYITDDSGSYRYDIFSAYEAPLGESKTYQIGFSSDESRQAFLDDCAGRSGIQTGVVPTIHDRVVTLSTCTGRGHSSRWVVHGVLRGEAPAEEPQN